MAKETEKEVEELRKADALALAQLIYDIYISRKATKGER